MEKYLSLMLFMLAVFCNLSNTLQAATFISFIDFPASAIVTDTQSGNTIDYVYEHDLSQLDIPDTTINSGFLQLKHLGNQDLGPTAEIWFALSGSGTFIGRLGKSQPKERTDHFELSQTVLDEIKTQNPWSLKIELSEQTSFNNEKLTLLQSELQIDYTRIEIQHSPSKTIPTTPEPSSFFLLAVGAIAALPRVWKKKQPLDD